MVRRAARARLSMPHAIFAFLAAVIVTVFGVVPSNAAPVRQSGISGDATAASAGDVDVDASVSIAAPDDTDEHLQVPGPVGAPAAELPEQPAHRAVAPAPLEVCGESNSPETTRGRAPPR